ncbi:glycoside hydrolase family 19 protein [Bosea sp. (in: a-proteobacteria)]|jgi:putative chitinase|uniref:glycoside hydrolase family 19 protein n=1 Tax=Bosea sp. (in: a-proteobacteria) TaxID=1871050 RepID=UPI0035614213
MSMRGSRGPTAPVAPPSGPLAVTADRLRRLVPSGKPAIIAPIAESFDRLAARYDIATRLRLCHFLAQAAHESDGFHTLTEYGGPAYFRRYDGRRDLGNTMPGDGARYHGRGIFQLTGRFNYSHYGALIGVDLEHDPDRAMEPSISLAIAFAYWRERDINVAADADDVVRVTKLINGGRTGLANRTRLLAVAKTIWV